MKKILALLAIFAFMGVVTSPTTASVLENVDKTVQITVDDDNTVDQDQDKKKKKTTKKVTKSTAKAGCGGCSEATKAGCGEAKEGCGSSCEGHEKKETKKKKS